MGVDADVLGTRIRDRGSRGHPRLGADASQRRTAGLSDLTRQRPLPTCRGETGCDADGNHHACRLEADDSRLETSILRLARRLQASFANAGAPYPASPRETDSL